MFAALALTPPATLTSDPETDGFLHLYEVHDLKLPECQLAVLSACETNAGEHFDGEGVWLADFWWPARGALLQANGRSTMNRRLFS